MELLVLAQDRTHTDFYVDAQLPKRGDVIAIGDDGHQWGIGELANPIFRVVVVPDLSRDDAEMLLAPEVNQDPKNPSKTLQFRAFKLDLDHPAVADQATFWNDHAVLDVVAKGGDLSAVAVVKTVPAVREDITLRKDANGDVIGADTVKVDVSYQKTIYRKGDVQQGVALADTAVTFVGPTIRAQAVVKLPAETILAIKTEKNPINDPRIFGGAKVEF